MVGFNEFNPGGKSDPTIDQDGGRKVKGDTLKRFINFLRIRSQRISTENASSDKIAEVKQAQKDFPAAPTITGPISKN